MKLITKLRQTTERLSSNNYSNSELFAQLKEIEQITSKLKHQLESKETTLSDEDCENFIISKKILLNFLKIFEKKSI